MRARDVKLYGEYAYVGPAGGRAYRVRVVEVGVRYTIRTPAGPKAEIGHQVKVIDPDATLNDHVIVVGSRQLVAPWAVYEDRVRLELEDRVRRERERSRVAVLLRHEESQVRELLKGAGWDVEDFPAMAADERGLGLRGFGVDPVSGEVRGLPVQVLRALLS